MTSTLPVFVRTFVVNSACRQVRARTVFNSTFNAAQFSTTSRPSVSILPGTMTGATDMEEGGTHGASKPGKNDIEEWKKRAPYKIHEKGDDFKKVYEASCHCGRVKYQLDKKEPLDSKLCHCTTCQTQHAAPFQWAAIFHKTDINFSHGHHDLEWYDPSSKSIEHKLPCKVRCSFCHSPIMDEGRNMILLFPSLIHFKNDQEKKNFQPRCHMFYGQRVIDIPDGLPKWTGLNETSELIEDSPKELVQEHERKRAKEQAERVEKGENQ